MHTFRDKQLDASAYKTLKPESDIFQRNLPSPLSARQEVALKYLYQFTSKKKIIFIVSHENFSCQDTPTECFKQETGSVLGLCQQMTAQCRFLPSNGRK
jgi:hypothetical protein